MQSINVDLFFALALLGLALIAASLFILIKICIRRHREIYGRCIYCGYVIQDFQKRCSECGCDKDHPELSKRRSVACIMTGIVLLSASTVLRPYILAITPDSAVAVLAILSTGPKAPSSDEALRRIKERRLSYNACCLLARWRLQSESDKCSIAITTRTKWPKATPVRADINFACGSEWIDALYLTVSARFPDGSGHLAVYSQPKPTVHTWYDPMLVIPGVECHDGNATITFALIWHTTFDRSIVLRRWRQTFSLPRCAGVDSILQAYKYSCDLPLVRAGMNWHRPYSILLERSNAARMLPARTVLSARIEVWIDGQLWAAGAVRWDSRSIGNSMDDYRAVLLNGGAPPELPTQWETAECRLISDPILGLSDLNATKYIEFECIAAIPK